MRWTWMVGVCTRVSWARAANVADFDWTSIPPSTDLHFSSCYNELECARLITPLDWLDYDGLRRSNLTVTLAIIKQPATVSIHDTTYGGSVVTNPGGPGDSGVVSILRNGKYIRNMMDSEDLHFDILSFDPRGMGFSLPNADCFASESARAQANAYTNGLGLPDITSNASLIAHKAADAALSLQCLKYTKERDGFSIHEYMSTASVARDMLSIVDKLDDLSRRTTVGVAVESQRPLSDDESGYESAKIQYYGTSYGTILGQTFLSMFPGRVHRMVLDGVVVADEYIAGDWCPWLGDTTRAVDYLYQTCFTAGTKCPLYKSSDSSWKSVKARLESLIEHLTSNPEPIALPDTVPFVIAGETIRSAIMDPIYAPLLFFESIAVTLAAALEGNYTRLLETAGALTFPEETCRPRRPSEYSWMSIANAAVSCGDSRDRSQDSPHDWRRHVADCEEKSPEIGLAWATGCMGWRIRPKFRFEGPFTASRARSQNLADTLGSSEEIDDKDMDRERPSAPVLFLSSLIDPVTPVRNARLTQKKFPGAGLVVQDSVGHCAMLSSPSRCTAEKVREYMKTGKVPKEDGEVKCAADCAPWKKCEFPLAQLPR